MSTPASRPANGRCRSSEAFGDELLPGIPNDIVVDQIVPKLPWLVFHILSSVSPAWLQAIRSRQVYDARVRSRSTNTLILATHVNAESLKNEIALCSVIHDSPPRAPPKPWDQWHRIPKPKLSQSVLFRLPPIPKLLEGNPKWSKCVSLDGKVYVLGGVLESTGDASGKVYVFDLAGQGKWKECASMKEPRIRFGCGVLNGKIYVLGGLAGSKPLFGSEVYDPKLNSWSSIRPMITLRFDHAVEGMGEKLIVHGGNTCDRGSFVSRGKVARAFTEAAKFLEIYDPVKDEWKVTEPFGRPGRELLFVAKGKFHSMSKQGFHMRDMGIHVHDADEKNSWTHLRSLSSLFIPIDKEDMIFAHAMPPSLPSFLFPFNRYCNDGIFIAELVAVLGVDDELLGIVFFYDQAKINRGFCLVQSDGFSSETRELVWQQSKVPLSCTKLDWGALSPWHTWPRPRFPVPLLRAPAA